MRNFSIIKVNKIFLLADILGIILKKFQNLQNISLIKNIEFICIKNLRYLFVLKKFVFLKKYLSLCFFEALIKNNFKNFEKLFLFKNENLISFLIFAKRHLKFLFLSKRINF